MNIRGRSLELFFVDGRPDGMLTAEVFNWTGHVLRIPRTQLKEGLQRPETERTGVYVLIGTKDGEPLAYIGETENLRERMKGHASGKDWWDDAYLISTASDALHKAHAKYLESRLVQIAKSVGSIPLENANEPPQSSLTEASVANMESFLETLGMVMPAIRVDMFLSRDRSAQSDGREESLGTEQETRFVLLTPKHGVSGRAILRKGEIIVLAGSRARGLWAGDTHRKTHYFKLHEELLNSGVLKIDGKHAVFTKDYAFPSPSSAAAVMNGRSSNGRRDWREEASGLMFGDWEQAQLAGLESGNDYG